MSKRRIRRSADPSFPYGKSVIASGGLIVAFMLVLFLVADPRSGEIRSPTLAYLVLAALSVVIAIVFCVEFRLRNKRTPTGPRQPNPVSRVKRSGKEEFGGSRKC